MARTEEQKLRHRLYMRKWIKENPEKHRLYMRNWRRKKPEKNRAIQKRYKIKHRETISLRKKIWYDENPGAHYRWNKKWRQTHSEKNRLQRARYRSHHRGFIPIAPNIFNTQIDWHHISPNHPYVVALPKEVHQAVYGKYHYIFNAAITAQLYNLNLGEGDDAIRKKKIGGEEHAK